MVLNENTGTRGWGDRIPIGCSKCATSADGAMHRKDGKENGMRSVATPRSGKGRSSTVLSMVGGGVWTGPDVCTLDGSERSERGFLSWEW